MRLPQLVTEADMEVIWLGFLFGSVAGVVLVLIFEPELLSHHSGYSFSS